MKQTQSAIIVLAAGSSSRMGSPKQLLAWGEVTLLQNAIAQAEASKFNALVVVLGAHAETIQNTIPEDIAIAKNPDWKSGMGSSIACGMRFLQESQTEFSEVLLLLGDQPLVDSDYIDQILETIAPQDKGIVATDYSGRGGVPALFTAKYFTQLGQLTHKFGAKELIAQNFKDVCLLNAGIKTKDIDTKQDYQELINRNT